MSLTLALLIVYSANFFNGYNFYSDFENWYRVDGRGMQKVLHGGIVVENPIFDCCAVLLRLGN